MKSWQPDSTQCAPLFDVVTAHNHADHMLHALDMFRFYFGSRPLLVSLTVFAAIVLVRMAAPGRIDRILSAATRTLLSAISVASLVAFAGIVCWYAADGHLFDYAEPSVIAVSWLFHVGRPVYHAAEAAERYSHIYGPMTFITYGAVLGHISPTIEAAKAAAAAAALGSVVLVFWMVRPLVGLMRAGLLTGVYVLLLLTCRTASFWVRPDPLELVVAAGALAAALSRGSASTLAAPAVVGVLSGVLWNLKFTGPLYSLPTFILLQRRQGARSAGGALAIAVVTTMLPFALPNVSLQNYLFWIRQSAGTGLVVSSLRQNLEFAVFMLLPLILVRSVHSRAGRPTASIGHALVGLLAGVAGVVIAAAKPGAQPYHLMPFFPALIYLVATYLEPLPSPVRFNGVISAATLAFLLTATAMALSQQAMFVNVMSGRMRLGDIDDLRQFATTHTGPIEMGYSGGEALSLERPLLVFSNNSYFLDEPAIREYELQGLTLPQATIDAVARCQAAYWIIPRDGPPFSSVNPYPAVLNQPLFSDRFRSTFLASYRRTGSTRYFDVWQCTHDR